MSGNTPLLASPIQATGTEYGQSIVWQTESLWAIEQTDEQVTLVGEAESRLVVLNVVIRVEFDGYVHYSLRLSPRGNHIRTGVDRPKDMMPREITGLHLVFPFLKEAATERYRSRPNENTVRGAVVEEEFAFSPLSWYGNERIGLALYSETDENWQSATELAAMNVRKEENQCIVTWNLLDSLPVSWAEARKYHTPQNDPQGLDRPPLFYDFSMQATPIKPFTNIALKEHAVHIDCFEKLDNEYYEFLMGPVSKDNPTVVMDYLKEKGVNCLRLHEKWCEIEGYWRTSPKRTEEIKQIVKEAHARGIKVMMYFTTGFSTLRPEPREYLERNRVLAPDGFPCLTHYRQPPQRCFRACAKGPDTFRVFIAGMEEAMDRFGADGIYLDTVNFPMPCTNAAHGCGYQTPTGRKPTWPVNEMHEHWRELYAALHEKRGMEIHIHPWESFFPAVLAYGDTVWNGEQLMIYEIIPNKGEVKLNLHFFRTEGMGINTGVPVQFLIYELPEDRWTCEKGISFCGIHGVWPLPNSIGRPLEVISRIWRILDDFGAAESTFVPYWMPGIGLTSGNENVLVSAYAKDEKTLYLVSNVTGTPQKAELTLTQGRFVCNARSGEVMTGRTAQTEIPPYTLLMLKAEK